MMTGFCLLALNEQTRQCLCLSVWFSCSTALLLGVQYKQGTVAAFLFLGPLPATPLPPARYSMSQHDQEECSLFLRAPPATEVHIFWCFKQNTLIVIHNLLIIE